MGEEALKEKSESVRESTIIGNLVRKKGRGENEDIDMERRQET